MYSKTPNFSKIPLPKRLEKLKKDSRGYIIPFFVPINLKTGKEDFKYMDPSKQALCSVQGLCIICGEKLELNKYYYILGPIGVRNQVSSDPAMHSECAKYSLQVCPHMHFQKAQRTSDETTAPDFMAKDKPSEIYLIGASNYTIIPHQGYLISKYSNIFFKEKWVYKDNILTKKTNHGQGS